MTGTLLSDVLVAVSMGLVGAVLFSALGLVSGTDETATIVPTTLVVILLGVPPVGVFTFWMAAVMAKHMTHAIPTALLGIPGDTMAVPLLQHSALLRNLGAPHVALRKMISGAIISAFVAVPLAVGFAVLLAPLGPAVGKAAPWIFVVAAGAIAYFSPGRWASLLALVPFVTVVLALQAFTGAHGTKLTISYFVGIAVSPLVADLFSVLSPVDRARTRRDRVRTFVLAPDTKTWSGYFPNSFKVLDTTQLGWTMLASAVTSLVFVFSPVAMTVMMGEIVGARIKQGYHRLTTVLAVRNGVTESTYLAETLIPLVAFGLPLSPMSVGPAAPLFNAPPRFFVDAASGRVENLHSMLSTWQFLLYGLVAVGIAALVAYPLAMNYAGKAAKLVALKLSHEAIIGAFVALVMVIGLWEGGVLGICVVLAVGLLGGTLNRLVGMNPGVQFMGYYVAVLTVPALLKAFSAG